MEIEGLSSLPDFTFYEARLLTLLLTSQSLPDLHIPPEPTAQDELRKKTQQNTDLIVRCIKDKVERFLEHLHSLDLSEFWDLDELRSKLESFSELQYFLLYFALKKHFWELEKHPTQAEALCDAGFFSKEKLSFAQRVEIADRRRSRPDPLASSKRAVERKAGNPGHHHSATQLGRSSEPPPPLTPLHGQFDETQHSSR